MKIHGLKQSDTG